MRRKTLAPHGVRKLCAVRSPVPHLQPLRALLRSEVSSLLSGLRISATLSEGGFSSVGYLDPLRIRRVLCVIVVVPVPPFVRRSLRVTRRRILPNLLTTERREIEVTPDGPHRFVAAIIDEVGAEHLIVIVADEHVVAVPLVYAEVGVEAVCDGVPRHLPLHSCLQA